jgi:hypothetical protein
MKIRRTKAKSRRQRQRAVSDETGRSPAFSYGASRPDQESMANREEKRVKKAQSTTKFGQFWLRRIGLLILLLALTASVTSSLTLSTDPEIVPIEENNNSAAFLHDNATYQAAASKLIGDSFLNRNKITIDTGKISKELIKQFPELSSVSITLPLLAHRPIVHIQAATPALILHAANGSYVLDSSGKALLPSGSLSSSVREKLPQVTDQSGLEIKLNQQTLPSSNVEFIDTVVAQLTAKQVKIESMTLPAASSELDVKIAGQPYFVKFNLQTPDARRQAGTFLATQAQLQRKNTVPSQYIDVRVEGRAYYK